MGMTVEVYRNADGYDCTNGGMTSSPLVTQVHVLNVPGVDNPRADVPDAWLVKGNLPNTVKLVCGDNGWAEEDGTHHAEYSPMFGVNAVHTSDSRWSEAIQRISGSNGYPSGFVPVHDRNEYEIYKG